MFVLNSKITMGIPGVNEFSFTGVNEVIIKRSIYSYKDTAVIKLPSIARVIKKTSSSNADTVITGKQFNDGDPVSINLGYNGNMNEEFTGFIKHRDLGMPLEITCEGYSYQLERNNINAYYDSVTLKDLLQAAVIDTDITVQCNEDITLTKINAKNWTGAKLIDHIQQAVDGNLFIFFIQPKLLWAGFLYTSYAKGVDVLQLGQVSYRLGYNLVKDNNLKERVLEDDPVKIVYNKKNYDSKY